MTMTDAELIAKARKRQQELREAGGDYFYLGPGEPLLETMAARLEACLTQVINLKESARLDGLTLAAANDVIASLRDELSKPLDDAELREIESLCDTATAGPWEVRLSGNPRAAIKIVAPGHVVFLGEFHHWSNPAHGPLKSEAERNAAFIAKARTAIPKLIAHIRTRPDARGLGLEEAVLDCPICEGSGEGNHWTKAGRGPCGACEGSGKRALAPREAPAERVMSEDELLANLKGAQPGDGAPSAADEHLGNVLYILADLHPDDQCKAFVDALEFYNGRHPEAIIAPSDMGYVTLSQSPRDARPEANAETAAALKCAIGHIEHMANYIGGQHRGENIHGAYSFESLGEDMDGIKAALSHARSIGAELTEPCDVCGLSVDKRADACHHCG